MFSDLIENLEGIFEENTHDMELRLLLNDFSNYCIASDLISNEEYKLLLISSQNLFDYCKTVYPERFFDILYQNEEVFTNDSNTCFLPQIDFAQLYFDTTSVQTKETLWKYLQLNSTLSVVYPLYE